MCNSENIQALLWKTQPDTVVHLAAYVGGIRLNQAKPAELFYDNLMIGMNTMHHAYMALVKKFVAVGTVCCYPKHTPVPFREEDLWNGYPEETNAPYGLAKKMLLVMGNAYRQQYGFNSIFLLPTNIYGPGDNFDPPTSHVIPALIRKFIEAREQNAESVTLWGTGKATRDFLYVEDAAHGIIQAALGYNQPEPMNLGSGEEIGISELAHCIAVLTGFRGEIFWDVHMPDGQPRRMLDSSRAFAELGWKATMGLSEGLRKTIDWYREHRGH